MAIIKFGTLVIGARGTIGGATLSANKSGPYAKAWAKSGDQRSPLQTSQRARLTTAAQLWRTLTTAQKADWDTYAGLSAQEKTNSLGETYEVSGFAWFLALTNNLLEAALDPILDAPVLTTPGTPVIDSLTFKATGAASDTTLTMDITSPGLDDLHIITGAVYNSAGRVAAFTNLTNLILAHPTNTTPAKITGTADASSVVGGNVAANANDGNPFTKWSGNVPAPSEWWRITTVPDYRVFFYGILGPATPFYIETPVDFTCEAWNGATWDTVDTRVADPPADLIPKFYNLADDSKITKQYRLLITKNNTSVVAVSMSICSFFGILTTLDYDLLFQDEVENHFGTIQADQTLFCEVRTQTTEGRRGPGATISATATA